MTAVTAVEVKETPLIVTGESVRAIFDGRKTQTRRVIKPQPHKNVARFVRSIARAGWLEEYDNGDPLGVFTGGKAVKWTSNGDPYRCSYGETGDRIWVKEVWLDSGMKAPFAISRNGPPLPRWIYRADYPGDWLGHTEYRLRNPMFMPRDCSRITLDITDIRVERIQDISEADAIAEGVRQLRNGSGTYAGREGPGNLVTPWPTAREAFADLWDSINGKRAPWESNPWVWAITFKKL